jgi:formylglycine-generating enzyme required for sulfatase activity
MGKKPAYIISDEPEKQKPGFGFDGYAHTIADLIAYKKNRTPLVIGIYGPWGSGKTTLMQTVAEKLRNHKRTRQFLVCKPVWFQAWKHAEEDAVLAALIEEIFKTMQADGLFGQCKAEIEKLASGLKGRKIVEKLSSFLTGGRLDVTEFFADLEHKSKLGFFPTFQEFFDRLVAAYVSKTGVAGFATVKEVDDATGCLVIFIDDLDRCPMPRVVKVLETIKLFMDKKGCVFVIGASREVIESALRDTYKGKGEAEKFMDKIVQVTFTLPKIAEEAIGRYLTSIDPKNSMLKDYTPLIARTLNHNPRAVKRFLNNLSLTQSLAGNLGLKAPADSLLRWSILEYANPSLAKLVKENPQYIAVMQEKIGALEQKGLRPGDLQVTDETLKEVQIPDSLVEFLRDRTAVELVKGFPADPTLINTLLSLSATTVAPEEALQKEQTAFAATVTLDKMTPVPKGEFLYGHDKRLKTIDHDYLIDIYPVTNDQYKKFIDAGGYATKEYWSEEGWKWREARKVVQPSYWDDPKWNRSDHPVVGVSFSEAEAYAKWAGKRLPIEEEWEKAARGTDGRSYPWGDEFDREKCNSEESGIGGTTSVTKYVNGISPYGCYDMAGNVWEWTSSPYRAEQGREDQYRDGARVVRGGSWANPQDVARCAGRNDLHPGGRYDVLGFRCCSRSPGT